MRIGVYGGSFNPIHLMHKEIVLSLLDKGYVDRIVILPTGNYYKKSNLLSGEERMKMIALSFKGEERVSICDYEFKNNLISTYRSLDYLQSKYPHDELYFIMGADNLLGFNTWKKYDYILDNYNLLIIDRNINYKEKLEEFSKYKDKIVIASDVVTKSISSSEIRELLFENKTFDYRRYLDKDVYDYIIENSFYTRDYKPSLVKKSLSDEEFLNLYSDKEYEKVSMTTDIVLFSVSDIEKENYRQVDKKVFSILLVKRNTNPYIGKWTLPGGFVSLDETLLDCAKRVLFSETNLDNIYLEQLYTFSEVERDPRTRVISCAYLGLVDKNRLKDKLNANASFFNVNVDKDKNILTITFESENEKFSCAVEEINDGYGNVSYKEKENDYLAFDHLKAIATSVNRLKNKIEYSDLVFQMMPKYFTLKQLQLVYEAILNKPLLDPVFRREIKGKVKKTQIIKKDGGHRPSNLYTYVGSK